MIQTVGALPSPRTVSSTAQKSIIRLHPLGRKIGIADIKLGETDIGLCKITDPDVDYGAESFAVGSGSIQLKSLKKETECWIGKELFIYSLFTGLGIGIVEMHGAKVIPVDGLDPQWEYVSNLCVESHGIL